MAHGCASIQRVKPLTSIETRQYLERWAAVAEFERDERARVPLQTRFAQLCALMSSRSLFEPKQNKSQRPGELSGRWANIRRHYGV